MLVEHRNVMSRNNLETCSGNAGTRAKAESNWEKSTFGGIRFPKYDSKNCPIYRQKAMSSLRIDAQMSLARMSLSGSIEDSRYRNGRRHEFQCLPFG